MDELKQIQSFGWNTLGGHDPTMIQDKKRGFYYLFSTDSVVEGTYTSGIQIRKSADKIHWEYVGTAFDGVPEEAFAWTSAEGLWAPEIIEYDGQYRMYYSASKFGSTTSCIGLATAADLQGPWEHQALVVRTNSEIATHNAIDANVLWDKEGNMWFTTDENGVFRYDGKGFKNFTTKDRLINNSVFSILEDKSGNIWFGTRGFGLSRYDGKNFTSFSE